MLRGRRLISQLHKFTSWISKFRLLHCVYICVRSLVFWFFVFYINVCHWKCIYMGSIKLWIRVWWQVDDDYPINLNWIPSLNGASFVNVIPRIRHFCPVSEDFLRFFGIFRDFQGFSRRYGGFFRIFRDFSEFLKIIVKLMRISEDFWGFSGIFRDFQGFSWRYGGDFSEFLKIIVKLMRISEDFWGFSGILRDLWGFFKDFWGFLVILYPFLRHGSASLMNYEIWIIEFFNLNF